MIVYVVCNREIGTGSARPCWRAGGRRRAGRRAAAGAARAAARRRRGTRARPRPAAAAPRRTARAPTPTAPPARTAPCSSAPAAHASQSYTLSRNNYIHQRKYHGLCIQHSDIILFTFMVRKGFLKRHSIRFSLIFLADSSDQLSCIDYNRLTSIHLSI